MPHSLSLLSTKKLTAHALSHPSLPVHGLLLGTRAEGTVHVTDVAPLTHSNPTGSILESGLALASKTFCEGTSLQIVGCYSAAARLDQTSPDPAALALAASSEAAGGASLLLTVSNKKLSASPSLSHPFLAFVRDSKGSHCRQLVEGDVTVEWKGAGEGEVRDFEDVLEGGEGSWRNEGFGV